MMKFDDQRGRRELRAGLRMSRGTVIAVAVFSFLVNLLMLTGPIYMLQIYDRVLMSYSEATLVALTILVVFLYAMMGILDFARGRAMARVGARFQTRLEPRVFDAVVRRSVLRQDEVSSGGLRDLEAVQKLLSSPVLMSVFDLPWSPVFLLAIAAFHPLLGAMALVGGAVLVALTWINQRLARRPNAEAAVSSMRADLMSDQLRQEAEMVRSMGMSGSAFRRWYDARSRALRDQLRAADLVGAFTSLTKTFRLFLQSAILGLGAWLVLREEITPGAMIAASILMGRALAPLELTIAQWPVVDRARKGWQSLARLLSEVPPEGERTQLPRPKARLDVEQLTVIPPGETTAVLRMVTFSLKPGQVLGVIGPSGSGKSTLARAITGVWRPAGGKIRLDGAALEHYDPEELGRLIGYLPQRVQLFDGTIAENIARLAPEPDADKVVEAAIKADAHEMILKLPEGYDTRISQIGQRLSGGQIQRIGLARALYGDPVLLVLDEPNSNLDNEGSIALNKAVAGMREKGGSAIIMAHRPAAIQECDLLLMLDAGRAVAFGPRDEVLRKVVQNYKQIQRSQAGGGIR